MSGGPVPGGGSPERPDLIVHGGDLPATVRALRLVLASADDLFDRGGVPVHLIHGAGDAMPVARRLTVHSVTMKAHEHCRPLRIDSDGKTKTVTLPERAGLMWLDLGAWNLRPLAGVTTAPLLTEDGGILSHSGYNAEHSLWCRAVPALTVPERPSKADAEAALLLLRQRFATFPFAGAALVSRNGVDVIDLRQSPQLAESGFLVALLTAVCRPSLFLAPGVLVSAPPINGAGSGKGQLVRAICAIAFGISPSTFTGGHDRAELDKRLVAELIEAKPVVFLDNLNDTALRSDTLASVLTERPARVRVMGMSQTVPLNSAAFIAATGNGLTVSEDLARRFIPVELDPQCENPEERRFPPGFLADVMRDRVPLLSACLTIWRWGRHTKPKAGLALGSFETWSAWCRDPLLALGCADPVERIRNAKAKDPQRQAAAALFDAWWRRHGKTPTTAFDLHPEVRALIDPQERGRNYIAARLLPMAGTRAAGYVLTAQPPAGKWSAITYALNRTDENAATPGGPEHRDHRGDRPAADPMPPMGPMPPEASTEQDMQA